MKKILFIGDSVTDCNRARPVGERRNLGDGYVSLVSSYFELEHYQKAYRVINMGISGNTVRDLHDRWTEDVLSRKPEVLTIMVGINDVWRQYDELFQTDEHVFIDEYKKKLGEIIDLSKDQGTRIILMSPFLIEQNKEDKMKKHLLEYIEVARTIAKEKNIEFIELQKVFEEYLIKNDAYSMTLSADRVHPNLTGHMIIAKAWLNNFFEVEVK